MTKAPRIVRRTELYFPSSAGEIIYVHPAVEGNYQVTGAQILDSRLVVPTGDLTAPLVHAAYCSDAKDEPEFANVRDITQKRWLWVFNTNLWTPQGVFVRPDRQAQGGNRPYDIKALEQKLNGVKENNGVQVSDDGIVRFAVRGSYALGEMRAKDLAQDGFMIASYGVEGAKLLAEAASTRDNNPITYGIDITENQNPEQRVSALDEFDSRLHFSGGFGGDDDGYAFGVSAPSAQKI